MPIMLPIKELSSLRRQTCLCLARRRDSGLKLERDEQFMNSPTDGGQAYNFCTAKKKISFLWLCASRTRLRCTISKICLRAQVLRRDDRVYGIPPEGMVCHMGLL